MSLASRLQKHGLFVRGVARLSVQEIETYGFDDDTPALALVGNIGSSYWQPFSHSAGPRNTSMVNRIRWTDGAVG